SIARVFVGRIELVTPATVRAVEDAIAAGDRDVLERYGRFLEPILNRIAASRPRAERASIDERLRNLVALTEPTDRCR
ncbi:MAG TPA: hypothetical protein VGY57_11715, partial [Vicinamibacterales bacterium]|nr:hypothetical protein [Vicinamibacterales bacterium]